MKLDEGTRIQVLAPVVRSRKGEYTKLFEDLQKEGFARVRVDGEVYELSYEPVECDKVCNQEKVVPREWISEDGTDINKAFLDYVTPLIQGEANTPMENGLPKYCYRR